MLGDAVWVDMSYVNDNDDWNVKKWTDVWHTVFMCRFRDYQIQTEIL